jgi:putative tricarboxylic transport membrane protein
MKNPRLIKGTKNVLVSGMQHRVLHLTSQKHRDLVTSLACIGLGIIFCIGSVRYGDIRARTPSGGYFPFIGGILLISISLVHLISATKRKEDKKEFMENFFPQRDSWKRLLLTLFALFAYVISIDYLGFLFTSFLFILFLLKFIEPQKWKVAFTLAILIAAASYALFQLFLKVGLPKGLLGI